MGDSIELALDEKVAPQLIQGPESTALSQSHVTASILHAEDHESIGQNSEPILLDVYQNPECVSSIPRHTNLSLALALLSSDSRQASTTRNASKLANVLVHSNKSTQSTECFSSGPETQTDPCHYLASETGASSPNASKSSNEREFSDANQSGIIKKLQQDDFKNAGDSDAVSKAHGSVSTAKMASTLVGRAEIPEFVPKVNFEAGEYFWENKTIEERKKEFNAEPVMVETQQVRQEAVDETRLAPIKGHGIPTISHKPGVHFEPSEVTDITDLGNDMHDRKLRDLSPSVPIAHDSDQEPLQERLLEARIPTPGHEEQKGFFPRNLLASVVNEECVMEELAFEYGQLDDYTIRNYARTVCGIPSAVDHDPKPYKKIFAILALCGQISAIPKFIGEKVTDKDLPLARIPRAGKRNIFDLGRRSEPHEPLACFYRWNPATIMQFEEWQWSTLAPFFPRGKRKDVNHLILPDQALLPFTYDSRRAESIHDRLEHGGFSQVFKVDIHPDHHDFHDPELCNGSFAIKCLLSADRKVFKREVEMLKKFSGDAHPHLVSLLSTYEQFGGFYLVFHWAEADLDNYWSKVNPNPRLDHTIILWIAEQCKGIADGLTKIHRYKSHCWKSHKDNTPEGESEAVSREASPRLVEEIPEHETEEEIYGRHGDIKPANVLWFDDPDPAKMGTLKLADFGLAEFNANSSKSHKKSKVDNTPSYRPPECDLQDSRIGPSYDIWTLGCVYLEFIIWVLGGYDLVRDFAIKRLSFDPKMHMTNDTFFVITHDEITGERNAVVKPVVKKYIAVLHSHKSCTEYLHRFLDLIEQDMLVVKPTDPAGKRRFTCQQVDHELSVMLENCISDVQYATRPTPRPEVYT